MGDHHLYQSRNLSVNQTLDEILGISGKSATTSLSSGSNGIEKSVLNSPIRPPTRHGRESAGSNEENKNPVQSDNGNSSILNFLTSSASSASSVTQEYAPRKQSDDDFIKKLNDIRRRSLISTVDMASASSNSVLIHPDSPIRESRPRLEIHVEESTEEPPQSTTEISEIHSGLSESSLGTSTEHEDPSLTFRVDNVENSMNPLQSKNIRKRPESAVKKDQKPAVLKQPALMQEPKHQSPGSATADKQNNSMQMPMFNSNLHNLSNSHHTEWLRKKEKELREKKLKENAAAEQKEAASKERRENAAKLYQRWVQDYDQKMRDARIKKLHMKKEMSEKEKLKKDEKLKEAEKNHEIWKRRSKSVSDIKKKLEQDEERKREKDDEEKNEKKKEAQAVFLAWKRKKDEYLAEEAEKQKKELEKKQKEEKDKEAKLLLAHEAYKTWIELKESQRQFLADFVLIEAPPIPWIPPSNLVPRQFVRTSTATRQRTRSQSAKSMTKRSKSRPSTTNSLRPFR